MLVEVVVATQLWLAKKQVPITFLAQSSTHMSLKWSNMTKKLGF
jgi:hypothetical protein